MLAPFLFTLLSAAAPDTAWGVIRGSVHSEPGGHPVPLAVVEVHAASGTSAAATTADSAGRYVLRRVPAGRQTVRVRHLAHAPAELEVIVPAGAEMTVDIWVRPRPLVVDTLQAVGAPFAGVGEDSVAAHPSELIGVEVRAMEDGSGVAASGLASGGGNGGKGGGNDPADPHDVLYVRGSAADLKLVLLDGAPVYAPFHTGGLIETFEPGVLRSARLYLGGAPARYDGGLSYVMDLATRAPNAERHAGTGSLDMMSAAVLAEGPLGRGAGYLVSGRLVHGASVSRLESEPFPYVFGDALGRVDLPFAGGRLSATGFANQEGVRIDTVPGREHFARWRNHAGSVRYLGTLGGSDAEVTAALGDFDVWLPRGTLRMEAHTRRARLAVDLARQVAGVRLRYGWSYDRTEVSHRVRERAGGESVILDATSEGDVSGAYLDAAWQPSARLRLRGGLRADMFSPGPFLSLAPRLSATWLLSDRAALTLAGGRYHQFVRVERRIPVPLPVPNVADSLGIATDLKVASANHLSLALDQELAEGVRLGLEGFFKSYEGQPLPEEVGNYSSGVDVWVRRSSGAVSGWLGYSLAWAWSQRKTSDSSDRFSGRQILSAGVGGDLGSRGRFGVRVAYGAGLPYTSLLDTDDGAPNPSDGSGGPSTPVPPPSPGTGGGTEGFNDVEVPLSDPTPDPYLRVDAELSRTWSARLGTRMTQVTPYLRVLNALNRRDGLFYRYNPDQDDAPRGVATLPVLPILGVEWKF